MPNTTENLKLKKPLPEEFYDVNVQNENMDLIDAELINKVPVLAKYYSPQTSGEMSADDLTVPFALIPVSSEVNPELYVIVGGTFAWVRTYFYIETTVTARRMQIAMSYNTVNQRMAFRTYGSNGWQPWEGLALTSKIPTKASDIKAFPSSGGTLTGQMTIKKYDNGHARFNKNHSDTNDYGTTVSDFDKDGKSSTINIRANEDKAYFTDNDGKYHEMYHEGNLPDITNIPITPDVPSDSNIWIDPDDETIEETHVNNKNNPHNVTATQVGAEPAVEDINNKGCYYRVVDGETEWINPPMMDMQEYRTIERFNGKPLYTRMDYLQWTPEEYIRYLDPGTDWLNLKFVDVRASFNNVSISLGANQYSAFYLEVFPASQNGAQGFQVMMHAKDSGSQDALGYGYIQVWYYKE